jgi:2'-hydroxyisoflavone reductase
VRILILGGTGFIGPWQIRDAVARGHDVTLFNRGTRPANLPPEVEHLRGDRAGHLAALHGHDWDVVIDNPVMLPSWVRTIAPVLEDHIAHYIFISTVSVYADLSASSIDERAPTVPYTDGDPFAVTMEMFRANSAAMYAPLKAVAEQEAERCFPGRTTIIRPGLIVGPGDPTDRFTYWPVRIARGSEVLAPGTPRDPVQVIDVRDLAAFVVGAAQQNATGVFNVTGRPMSIGSMLETMCPLARRRVTLTFVDAEFLEAHGVHPWSDMPVWFPPRGEMGGVGRVSIKRALAAGLALRPIAETARDTFKWFQSLPADRNVSLKAGISPDREAEVLDAWHALQM